MKRLGLQFDEDKSAAGIAQKVHRLVSDGSMPPGTRLPPVRDIARDAGVSPATVGQAWKHLLEHGVIETRGRLGTFVLDPSAREPWRQFRRVIDAELPRDLSTGFPDPELLPDLGPFLEQAAREHHYLGYESSPILAGLLDALRKEVSTEITNDNTILATHIIGLLTEVFPVIGGFRDGVVVGETEFAPYLDLLERAGLSVCPVPFDSDGLVLADVEAEINAGATGIILQPRVHNPTGTAMAVDRLRSIARLCSERDVTIIETDHFGQLSSSPRMSAMQWAPKQTLYVRSFAKDLHPDIRVAVAFGAPRIVDSVRRRRVGGFDVSGINQELLRLMLLSPEAQRVTARAKQEYDRRRTVFVSTLVDAGIPVNSVDGLNVWVPVRSEQDALIHLASNGISAAPGSAFQARPDRPHIRVSIAGMDHEVAKIAALVAAAALATRLRG